MQGSMTMQKNDRASQRLEWTAGSLADMLGAELIGPADLRISRLGSLDHADAQTLAFIRDQKHAVAWASSDAGAAIVSRGVTPVDHDPCRALLIVDDADCAMIALLENVAPDHACPALGVAPTASVDPSVKLGARVRIGPGVSVGPRSIIGDHTILNANVSIGADVVIGDACDLRSGVVIEDRCSLGARVVIHPNVVIGADGFGYRPHPEGAGLLKIPHAGAVEIHDDVEIGAGTTIDRGKFGDTIVNAGAKIDNLVQIGHNCSIGKCCIICGACGIAGSVTIGDGAVLGGGVGVKDNITIGAGATIGARAAVMDHIPAGETWFGYPARPAKVTMRILAATGRLPKLFKTLRERGIDTKLEDD